jgi:hypothetical protein
MTNRSLSSQNIFPFPKHFSNRKAVLKFKNNEVPQKNHEMCVAANAAAAAVRQAMRRLCNPGV